MDQWLRDYVPHHVWPRTAERYAHIIRQHLILALGEVPLVKLTPQEIQNYNSKKPANVRRDGKGA